MDCDWDTIPDSDAALTPARTTDARPPAGNHAHSKRRSSRDKDNVVVQGIDREDLDRFLARYRTELRLLPRSMEKEASGLTGHQRDIAFQTSWIATHPKKPGCIGCRPCAKVQKGFPSGARAFARYRVKTLKLSTILKDGSSTFHRSNTRKFLGLGCSKPKTHAPSAKTFKALWKGVRKGSSLDSLRALGGREKLGNMRWCLAEALRIQDRQFLASAACICLARDERDGRLVVRFSATDSNLTTRRGLLGLARDWGSGAQAIADTTVDLVQQCSVTGEGMPRGGMKRVVGAERVALHSHAVATHVLRHVEAVTTDAARDEILGSELLQTKAMPNLRFILRDKAHGARRTSNRTLACCKHMPTPWHCQYTVQCPLCNLQHQDYNAGMECRLRAAQHL
jgi:hypothetical protein